LRQVPESEYDKQKAELVKSLETKMQLSECAEQKRGQDLNLLKKLKNEVEQHANELIRQINAGKKQLFKELETKCKNLNRNGAATASSLAESIPLYEKDQEREAKIKEELDKNSLSKDWINFTNASLLDQIAELETKIATISDASPSIEFCMNTSTKIESNFIGEIKEIHNTSTLTSLVEEMTIQPSSKVAVSNRNKNRKKKAKLNDLEKSSILLTSDKVVELMKLCEFQPNQKWQLLYRASRMDSVLLHFI